LFWSWYFFAAVAEANNLAGLVSRRKMGESQGGKDGLRTAAGRQLPQRSLKHRRLPVQQGRKHGGVRRIAPGDDGVQDQTGTPTLEILDFLQESESDPIH
jgi:hypothetical protein